MITIESVSRANVWEIPSQDRGWFIAGFIRALAGLITEQEGNAESSQCFEFGKPFFSFISRVSVLWNSFWGMLI